MGSSTRGGRPQQLDERYGVILRRGVQARGVGWEGSRSSSTSGTESFSGGVSRGVGGVASWGAAARGSAKGN
eukprot:4513242-Amphidinium_carterae.3